MNGNDIDSFRIQALSIYLWALTHSELIIKTTLDAVNPEAIYVGSKDASTHNEVIMKTTGCHEAKGTPEIDQSLHPCESGVLTIMYFIQTALPPMYKPTSFVKDELCNWETCLWTRLKVASFIRYMYSQNMQLHNPQCILAFQKLESNIFNYPLHESSPAKFQIITALFDTIDYNALTNIHINDHYTKSPEAYDMCIHDIGHLVNESELIDYPWFENSNELERVFKTERAKVHPGKFSSSSQEAKEKASDRFVELTRIFDLLRIGVSQ